MPPLVQELIRRKRDGERVSPDDLRWFVQAVTDGTVPDYQAAAMLMAIYFRGLDEDELAAWADAMLRSGDIIDLPGVMVPKVDKHSTGGVGDKISLPLAPAAASCGIAVPMVSGRGLGHTGGTLDKLEAIPGFRVDLPAEEFAAITRKLGTCLIGQSARIAPADRKLYALRDVTATVESIPLIASSIMSKKLAEGIDGLVLDCKVGSGAFMKTLDRARQLARTIQQIGRSAGKRVTALLTDMSQPIGRFVGNAVEVAESIEILRGRGPADTRALTIALGAEMLVIGQVAADAAEGSVRIARALDDGSALERFQKVVEAQGGDPRVCDTPETVLPQVPGRKDVVAPRGGTLASVDAQAVGTAVVILGGGRRRTEDKVDPAVGIEVLARIGDRVERGQPLARIHHRGDSAEAEARLAAAFVLDDRPHAAPPLIHETIR
jgi:pyrimidine-nucleoside phosphorylase